MRAQLHVFASGLCTAMSATYFDIGDEYESGPAPRHYLMAYIKTKCLWSLPAVTLVTSTAAPHQLGLW